ncbi:PrsW family intramembrane metalloprotease [Candidatus Falkowbacteria bacterium]|nr:PrsW family intramembrane metalloprotease [Candidatus Falkowbacteria bacterium]
MQKVNVEIMPSFSNITYGILIAVAGLILPALLIPLVKFAGYSEIFEEIAKALVILFLIFKLPTHKAQILAAGAFGFLFGLSENIFYLTNVFALGDFNIFWQRFLLTVPMHIITVLVMVFAGLARKYLLILGLVGAVVLHILFNGIIIDFLMR